MRKLPSSPPAFKPFRPPLGKSGILVFQLLLFATIFSTILAASFAGAAAAIVVATLFSSAAFVFYWKKTGFDSRALFTCLVFYLLALFFVFARFFASQFSFTFLPIAAVAFSGLLAVFRMFVYNRRGEGIVSGTHGRFLILQVLPSAWHSLSGVQAFEGEPRLLAKLGLDGATQGSALRASEGVRVKVFFSPGIFSQPRITRVELA